MRELKLGEVLVDSLPLQWGSRQALCIQTLPFGPRAGVESFPSPALVPADREHASVRCAGPNRG